MIFYSQSRNSFYDSSVHKGRIPEDAIEVRKSHHRSLLEGQSSGKRISAGEDGHPVLADRPLLSIDKLAYRQSHEIDTARDQAFAAGMPFTFHDGSEDVVQTRPEDKSNLLGIAIEARDLRDAGVADPVIEFRAASNTTYAITPAKAIEMTNAALAHVKAIYDQSWQRKDAIKAALEAEDREGIEAVTW